MADQALVVEQSGRNYWTCPVCRRRLGEVFATRLVVLLSKGSRERTLTFPLIDGLTQTCPSCGAESAWLVRDTMSQVEEPRTAR